MPSNYIKLFRAPTDSQAKHDIEKQQAQIKLIASDIKNKVQKQLPDSLLSIFYNFIYKNWRRNLVNCSKSFYVQKTCTSCGLCVKLCPEQIIKLVNNTPTWNGKCQDCLACINLCPTKAIQSNFLTKIYGRYKNPFIKVENLVK